MVDLGCGPGNSTELLIARYPQAEVIGVDSSPDMLRQARERLPKCTFVEADLAHWRPRERTRPVVRQRGVSMGARPSRGAAAPAEALPEGGVLAVQMPDNTDEPALRSCARSRRRALGLGARAAGAARDDLPTPADYYDLLRPLAQHLDIWHTVYNHVMAGPDASSNGSRARRCGRFWRRSTTRCAPASSAEYTARIAKAYPARFDGKVLLRFPRLFIVAVR